MRYKLSKAYLFLFPAAFIYLTFIVFPTFYSVYLSFFEWNGVTPVMKFVGFGNYIQEITKDSVFQKALLNNVIWTALSLVFTTLAALLLALLINKDFKGRSFYRSIFYFPYTLSLIVVSIMWSWIYHPQMGIINTTLEKIGLGILAKEWLSDPSIALYSVFIAALWQYVGAPMIMFLAGLQSIPKEPYESANIDGANTLQTFFYITIPMLKETFVIVIATSLAGAMRVFDIIIGSTGGGPASSTETLASWMYRQTFEFSNLGIGTTIACILVVSVMVTTLPYIIYMSKE